ncbi:MAG: FMN-binding protein [Butyricicoccaceae bacterium]
MIFLISLALAALFILACAKPLKKHPVPFYAAAAAAALAVIGCTWCRVSFPAWFQTWIWPLFARGAFATALFAVVMWTGALPNGSKAMRLLMPVRGELSILASILTLGHNLAYGQTYFRLLFTLPGRLPANQRAAAVCSLVLISIMLPLFVTSFRAVRSRMDPRSWKQLQRLAYAFYGLLYVHIMLLSVPSALAGYPGYALNILVYSIVFLGYGACRITKARMLRIRQTDGLPRRQAAALAGALALSLCLTAAASLAAARPEVPAQQADPQTAEDAGPETADPETDGQETQNPTPDTPITDEDPETAAEPEEAPEETPPETAEGPSLPAASAPAAEPAPAPAPAASAPSSAPAPEPEPEPTPQPDPAPARVYKNGTFSGSGEGYWSTITVNVTIQDDVITGITVVSADEDEPFYSNALTVIDRILALQSTNVDTVSGATYSSGGILDAVAAALAGARNR